MACKCLIKRRQRVCVKSYTSAWLKITTGVLQGSVLGTTLFLIFIYDIIKGIRRNVRLLEVDTSLYKNVERPSTAVIELNIDLQTIFALAKQWFVDFNVTKTKSLIISKMRKKHDHQSLWSIQIFKTPWNCFYRECHNHKPQPFPDTKTKRKLTNPNKHKSNKRTKSTKISCLFPKRGNRNTKRTEKHKNKMTHGKTYSKSPRRINHKATKSKTNTGTTALERPVE